MYRIINGIPVWGEHDDATIGQIERCAADPEVRGAALMADGHKGYSMPIGGVVAYQDAVSPSGVGYDISCLAAGTPVTTMDGYCLPVEQVRADSPITCWDGVRVRPVAPHFGVVQRGHKPVLHVTLRNRQTIRVTADHAILTRTGWKEAGTLTSADAVACSPFVGMPYTSQTGVIPLTLPHPRLQQELVEHGLYPLDTASAFFPAVVRLLGSVSGTGSLARDGKQIALTVSSAIDAADLVHDVAQLGYRARVDPPEQQPEQPAIRVRIDSAALHALLHALGVPLGPHNQDTPDLDWLFQMAPWVRAHYLSALCSTAMLVMHMRESGDPELQLSPARANRAAGHLAGRLFRSLGFELTRPDHGRGPGGSQEDSLLTLAGETACTRFLAEVGFCYAHAKRVQGAEIAGRIGQPDHPAAGSTGEISWVPVQQISQGPTVPVYDVVTHDPAHAFFGAGMVVHNCGNKAVLTNIHADDLRPDIKRVMDAIARKVVFGIGQTSGKAVDHELFDDPTWRDVPHLLKLKQMAREQLGTVGSGNHFVDLFEDEEGRVWVGVHFGSRGFGHRTASGFLNLSAGRPFDAKAPGEHMDQPATVLSLHSDLGQAYWQAMTLAGRYAYAGRDFVVNQVLKILGADMLDAVHNHHNYAWRERVNDEDLIIVRKGATPAWPGQRGFVGGSMGDISVIIEGLEGDEARAALHSTIHGAGRLMSRTRAAGRRRWVREKGRRVLKTVKPGEISREMMQEWVRTMGVELRGAGTDESPHVYRALRDVLTAHQGSIRILHTLRPLGVAMAGEDVEDPYKD